MEKMYLFAGLGAIALELIKLIDGKYNPSIPNHLKTLNFWLAFFAQILIGLLTYHLLRSEATSEIAATACGFSGATILTKLLHAISSNFNPGVKEGFESTTQSPRTFFWYWH